MKATVKFEMQLPAKVRRRKRGFVAHCEPLDVVGEGETREQAIARLTEALQLFVETCYEMGTLDQVLQQAGFSRVETIVEDEPDAGVIVPISLLAQRDGRATCAA